MNKSTGMAMRFLSHRNPLDVTQVQYVIMLQEFAVEKGEAALRALAGFYLWIIANKKDEEQTRAIVSTFSHDLGGRFQKHMDPRSSGYEEFWNNELPINCIDQVAV